MIQPGGELDLSEKTVRAKRRGEVGVKDLECDNPLVLCVLSQKDSGHPSPSELAIYCIRLRQRFSKLFDWK